MRVGTEFAGLWLWLVGLWLTPATRVVAYFGHDVVPKFSHCQIALEGPND